MSSPPSAQETAPGPSTRSAGEVPRRDGAWRAVVAALLVVVAVVLAPLAVVAAWADDEIGDTDRYVDTVGPLAEDPAVQDAVIARITTELTDRLDVAGLTREAVDALDERGVPPRVAGTLESLAAPLAAQVRSYVEDAVTRLVRSDAFADAWASASREAHTQMVAVLSGADGAVVATDGTGAVSVDLATVVDAVKQRLVDRGFRLASTIPEVDARFTIFQSTDVLRARTGFRVLGALSAILPWLALASLAGAAAVARSRRRALVAGALAVAASMVVLGLALDLARLVYLDAVPSDVLPAPAAAAVFDALVHFVRLALRSVLVLFLVVASVTWVGGPGAAPVGVRRAAGRALAGLRRKSARVGMDTGALGTALHRYRGPIRVAVAAAGLSTYVMAAHPTGRFTAAVAGTALLVLLVAEVLARPESPPSDDVTGAPTSGA